MDAPSVCEGCPVLLASAEAERLLEFGLVTAGYAQMTALLVGRLRQEHGCRGPRHGLCRWHSAALSAASIAPRPDVPYVGRRFTPTPRPEPGEVPGQWL